MTDIGWGIIGCGDVADRKAGAAFNDTPGSRLVAVMRRDESAAQQFADKHGAQLATTDAASVIEHPDVNIVYVATPPALHLEYALQVAAAGKACLVEKPAGRSLEELTRMREVFRAASLPVYVSYYRRHLPRFLKVKEIVQSGALGEISTVTYLMSKPAKTKAWKLDVAASGGGHFYDLSGHMLDLFEDWFGPLQFAGGAVRNVLPEHVAEDVVSLSFATESGVVGAAHWNFAASHSRDELTIEGTFGRVIMSGTSTSNPVRVEYNNKAMIRLSQSKRERIVSEIKKRLKIKEKRYFRFDGLDTPHGPLIGQIVEQMHSGLMDDTNIESALRTATVVDQVLAPYYGGRSGAFWERPQTFRSLQVQASERNQGPIPDEHTLTQQQLEAFEKDGYLGPFTCDGAWDKLVVPVKKGRQRHMQEADVFTVSTDPSIVRRVAQVMGQSNISLFKTRFVVKLPNTDTDVAWHQDSGARNGGYTPDGKPVPTVVVWLALDDVDESNACVQVIPGSHTRLVGDFSMRIRAELVEKGVISEEQLNSALPMRLKKGEFFIFHAWVLHGSGVNGSDRRRAGLNVRFAPTGYEFDEDFTYVPIECGEVPVSDRIFRNEPWAA
jgi:predicted dehydrogenase